VVRDVAAWKMAGEELATGDLMIGAVPAPQGIRASVEPYVTAGEAIGAYLELYSTAAATFDGAEVILEIGDDPDSPPLVSAPATLAPGARESWRVATGVLGALALPPGRYVARAHIVRGGRKIGVLSRPFVLEREANSRVSLSTASAASVAFAGTLPKFDRAMALRPDVVSAMFDLVEKRSPALKEAVAVARAGRYGAGALEALSAGDQTVASFLKGLDLFTQGQLDEAATQLHISAGERRDFFPAAFYLGAAFAAAGRDRDAAGIWQLALGSEPRPAAVYAMVADARLRGGQPTSAIDILKPAFDRHPADSDLAKRLGIAYVLVGSYAEAVPVLDAYLTREPSDQDALLAAVVAQYETARAGQTLSNVDRAKLRKYSAAYKGPEQALVDKYLTTLQVR
jgi:tetratricopeptide (TPR) repeat protein